MVIRFATSQSLFDYNPTRQGVAVVHITSFDYSASATSHVVASSSEVHFEKPELRLHCGSFTVLEVEIPDESFESINASWMSDFDGVTERRVQIDIG